MKQIPDDIMGIVAILMLVAIIWLSKGIGKLFRRGLPKPYCVVGAALVAGIIGAATGLGLVWFSTLPKGAGSLAVTALACGFVAAFQAGATASGSTDTWSVISGDD